MVKKVNATYVFEIADGGTYHIDLKEGEGKVGEGNFVGKPDGFKPDVVFKLNKETTLKLFNSKLSPQMRFEIIIDCSLDGRRQAKIVTIRP